MIGMMIPEEDMLRVWMWQEEKQGAGLCSEAVSETPVLKN
jgi:hypothetical protein